MMKTPSKSAPKGGPSKAAPSRPAQKAPAKPARSSGNTRVEVSGPPKERTIEIRQIENGYVVRESWREKSKNPGKYGPETEYKSKETFTKSPPKITAE